MSQACLYGCGRETNNHDGVCAGCSIDIHCEGKPRHMTEEEFKNFGNGNGGTPRLRKRPRSDNGDQGKETEMATKKGKKEKVCVGFDKADGSHVECGKTFKPTSNVQKRCDDCRAAHKTEKTASKGEKSGGGAQFYAKAA